MKQIQFQIEGVSPLLMHSSRLVNPLDPYTKKIKEISGKRKKTEADFQAMSDLELEAGMYWDSERKVIVPDINLEQCIVDGAKKDRLGKDATAGVTVERPMPLCDFSGRQYTVKQVLDDELFRFVVNTRVQRSSIMRTRPRFDEWAGTFTVTFNPDILNAGQVVRALEKAGSIVGIGDWRPKFGRFNIVHFEEL